MSLTKQILVPTDFSEQSQAAVHHACDLAKQFGAGLHLIHVISDAPGGQSQTDRIRIEMEQVVRSIDERAELSLKTTKKVIPGDPCRVILDYIRDHDIDLVVMGTHGRTGIARFALGSVAERVVRSSPCPVMVLGHQEERIETVAAAAQVIAEKLGRRFQESLEDGIEKMQTLIESQLDLPADKSKPILDQLQRRERLIFEPGEPGTWSVIGDVETVASRKLPPTAPVSQAVDLIDRARRLRATDIHLDPTTDNEQLVRLRIDGKLQEYCRLDEQLGEHLVNQLKTMSDINIAEPFLTKEGRVKLPDALSDLEVRITTAPVAAGEAVALRLFARENIFLPLHRLGLTQTAMESVEAMLRLGEGLVLVTGPTGSGKTTTVYSMLESLGGVERNVVSVEDPVEFAVPFVRQLNVDVKHGITMTRGLRTILRMDPDVVFLGEIRDAEAAEISMRAANSGRYVLTTLHTRDVAATVTALRDMNIGDRSISGNLTGIINQRLIRRLCPECRQARSVSPWQAEKFGDAQVAVPDEVFLPNGCAACRNTGFFGRIGAFEVALVTDNIRNAISGSDSEHHLRELLRSSGVISLACDALSKAAQGITSVDEALSVHWLT